MNTDHAFWGRAEDMGGMYRPSYSVDPNKPGARAPGRSMHHGPGPYASRVARHAGAGLLTQPEGIMKAVAYTSEPARAALLSPQKR